MDTLAHIKFLLEKNILLSSFVKNKVLDAIEKISLDQQYILEKSGKIRKIFH